MKIAVWIIVFTIITLSPIIIGVKFYFDANDNKLYFGIYLFDHIRIIKGWITFTKKRAIIKIGSKKKSLPYKRLLENRIKLNVLSGLEITSITALLEIGSQSNKLTPIMIASAYCSIGSILLCLIKRSNPLMNAFNAVHIREDEDLLKYNFSINVTFNLILLIIASIKKLTEKILNGKGK